MKETDDVISVVPADEEDAMADYQTNAKTPGFFYKTSLVPIHSWQLWENPKNSLRRSSSARSINSPHHRRRLASITSIPEADRPKVAPPANPIPPPLLIDPYAPNPNVIRVERIRDDATGRDVYIRWLKSPTEVIPPSPIPIYDFQMKNDMIDRLKKEVQIGLDRLVLEEEAKKAKKKKKKKKHHKHSKSYREEYLSSPVFTPIQPAYSPVPFEPQFFQINAPSPVPSAPFWFYPM